MISISLEGNRASGKTEILRRMKLMLAEKEDAPPNEIHLLDDESWGDDPFSFNSLCVALFHNVNRIHKLSPSRHVSSFPPALITSRSVLTTQNVFMEHLNPPDELALRHMIASADVSPPDLFVYIKTSPAACFRRRTADIQHLQKLHSKHEAWFPSLRLVEGSAVYQPENGYWVLLVDGDRRDIASLAELVFTNVIEFIANVNFQRAVALDRETSKIPIGKQGMTLFSVYDNLASGDGYVPEELLVLMENIKKQMPLDEVAQGLISRRLWRKK